MRILVIGANTQIKYEREKIFAAHVEFLNEKGAMAYEQV